VLYQQLSTEPLNPMQPFFRRAFLSALLITSASAWAGAAAPVVASTDCFGSKVELRSTCSSEMPPYVECSSQVLRIGDKDIQLRTKANRDLSAGEWACVDNKRLLVLMSNGANCEQCEKAVAFDKDGKPMRVGGAAGAGKQPAWKDIPVLNRSGK
jgi:hypothetical protein